MATIYGTDRKKIVGTLNLLRYFRRFLDSDKEKAIDPESGWMKSTMTKQYAERRLGFLINVAINRKAGIPDVPGRKHSSEYQTHLYRDAQRLRDIHNRIRVYQFETQEVKSRFSHLLSRYDD